jgi:hypothetical protein
MGANTSKGTGKVSKSTVCKSKMEDMVDLGAVFPNGLYPTTEQDYDPRVVRSLIVARKIAPFYKGIAHKVEMFCILFNLNTFDRFTRCTGASNRYSKTSNLITTTTTFFIYKIG